MARTGWRNLVSWLAVLACLAKLLPGPLITEAAWLARQPGDPATTVAAHTRSDRVPVVLVHGLRGSGPGSWGEPANEGDWPSGIYSSLRREGYTPGKDLFVCDYSDDHLGDYREIARSHLAPVIAQACAVSGWDRVDILARSMGGLVARAYLSSELYRGDVRTLVMLATPHRGSFGAGIAKSVEMIALQEQIRQRGPEHRRVLERPVLPADWDLIGEFVDEVSYVARQSQEVWEPLFGYYYTSAWLLAERDGGGRYRPPPFLAWLEQLFPSVFRALLPVAGSPPVSPTYEPGGPGSYVPAVPGPGESLTRSYYELLAIQSARHNYFLGMRLTPPEVVAPAPHGGTLERIVAWLAQTVQRAVGAVIRQKAPVLATWAMEHLTGLDLRSRAADCLIAETVAVTTGGPVPVSPDRGQDTLPVVVVAGRAGHEAPHVAANYYLRAWNEWEAEWRRALDQFVAMPGDLPPGVRYVSIAGQIPNVWSGLWPQVGPNDVIVEAASTFLLLGDNDVFHLIPSLFTTNHVLIGASGASWRAVAAGLREYYPIKASFKPRYLPGQSRLVSYVRRGSIRAEVYQPVYLELEVPAAGRVEVRLAHPFERVGPAGEPALLSAWVYLELPGWGLHRYQLEFELDAADPSASVARVAIDVPEVAGARLLVGTRAMAFGQPDTGPPPNTQLRYSYELSYAPEGVPVVGEARKVPDPASSHLQPAAAKGGGALLDQESLLSPRPTAPAVTPVIRAIYRNKQPVHLAEQVVAHQYWQWDFGDGDRLRDVVPGKARAEVEHTYARPGVYEVTAVSWSTQGTELATWTWRVEVHPHEVGQPLAFIASTVAVPEVHLKLEGPLAWVTGRMADYSLSYEILDPAGRMIAAEIANLYPGPYFQMVWERPGTFLVNGALTLRLTYRDGSGARSVTNVYTVERSVRVYATVVTD